MLASQYEYQRNEVRRPADTKRMLQVWRTGHGIEQGAEVVGADGLTEEVGFRNAFAFDISKRYLFVDLLLWL